MNVPLRVVVHNGMWDQPPDLGGQSLPPGCELSTDSAQLAQADAVVFHTPSLHAPVWPRKRAGQLWVAWSMECEVHYPEPCRASPGPFDLFMTYREEADVQAAYSGPEMLAPMRRPPQPKTAARPVACFISAGIDRSGRTEYLRELMRYVGVDSYGRVFRNSALAHDTGRDSKLATIARYKFTLAFENARAPDYVTEKLYDPLVSGSVPIYLGAPNVDDFVPGDGCFINVDDYPGPRALAAYLRELDADAQAYARYFDWKQAPWRAAFATRIARQSVNPWVRLCQLLLRIKGADAFTRRCASRVGA